MAYLTQAAIADDNWMRVRVSQCAAQEGKANDPDDWTYRYRRIWSAAPGWDAAWESAWVSHEGESGYSPGKDEAVITDGQILSQVQVMPGDAE